MKIKYGTRGSALALAQSDEVARHLRQLRSGLEVERVIIHTSGDRFGASYSSPLPLAGKDKSDGVNVKAMFVKEIEEALVAGTIDFAVHSCKDLPADLPKELVIAGYPTREDPRDVYIGREEKSAWASVKKGDVIGTAALRRQIQLSLAKPGIKCMPLRGNVDTRLKKLLDGAFSGLVLAKAGLKRLGREKVAHEILPIDVMVPSPGQGALGLEARKDRADVLKLLAGLEDPDTRLAVEFERSFMKAIGGGCRTPLGAHASKQGGMMRLDVFWSDAEGRHPIRRSGECAADPTKLALFAKELAAKILRP